MSTKAKDRSVCAREEIAAYLDGELVGQQLARLEEHLADCPGCAAELERERRLLLELDFALSMDEGVLMPENFAQVVAARAESDLSGVRCVRERKRALLLCVLLSVAGVALIGGPAAREAIFTPLRAGWRAVAALLGFLGHMLYDAGAGLAVISRKLGGHFVFESRAGGLLVLLLFVAALFILRRMIAGYHAHSQTCKQS